MTETEWLSCGEPRLMLDHIRPRASARKLRCFACACVRAVWDLLLDRRSQLAVETAERFADGWASAAELAEAEVAAFEVARVADLRTTVSDPSWAATRAAARAANLDAYSAASGAAFVAVLCEAPWAFGPLGGVLHHGDDEAKARARARQCDLLREVIGNPFRPVVLDPAWLAWNNGTVARLAREVHQEQRFAELPVLADALEEAGCASAETLEHCRRPGGHFRGCWVVDLILGKC
jgi:hypothetical protein